MTMKLVTQATSHKSMAPRRYQNRHSLLAKKVVRAIGLSTAKKYGININIEGAPHHDECCTSDCHHATQYVVVGNNDDDMEDSDIILKTHT